uniref:CUE domain-containing protein n=1 Tax=Steinernema glaseri TaxID=37863 RepID=A0A1I7ZZQ4_9BILA
MATSVERLNAINAFIDSVDVDEWTAELFLDNNDWNVSDALNSYNETKEIYELMLPDSVYYKYRERYSTDDHGESYDSDCDDPLVIPYGSGRAAGEPEDEANAEPEREEANDEGSCVEANLEESCREADSSQQDFGDREQRPGVTVG